jgi:glycosyltransferase involved in cell wall biosynthesis
VTAPPAVSVIVPVYNGAPHLEEALGSILRQTLTDLEVVVIDDGSTDDSAAIAAAAARRDRRVRVAGQDRGGAARAANHGIGLSRGRWIARCDADDLLPADSLAHLVTRWRRGDLIACGGQAELFGQKTGARWFATRPDVARLDLIFRPCVVQPVLMAGELARRMPYADGVQFDDYELWTRLALEGAIASIPGTSVRYRRWAGQSQATPSRTRDLEFRAYGFRYFYALFPGTPLERYLPIARLREREPFATLGELIIAGDWMQRYAAAGDPPFTAALRRRWRAAWDRSPALHPAGRDTFDRVDAGLSQGVLEGPQPPAAWQER